MLLTRTGGTRSGPLSLVGAEGDRRSLQRPYRRHKPGTLAKYGTWVLSIKSLVEKQMPLQLRQLTIAVWFGTNTKQDYQLFCKAPQFF